MQLTGDLSDFALTDILQILSLSRKTGTVLLSGAGWEANIVVESGRITFASRRPGDTLADSLAIAGMIDGAALRTNNNDRQEGAVLVKVLVDSGVLTRSGLAAIARRHTQRVIGKLVLLEKGRFSIALGEDALAQSTASVRLKDGLDVGETLLRAAQERDERDVLDSEELRPNVSIEQVRSLNLTGSRETRPLARIDGGQQSTPTRATHNGGHNGSELLCSLLAEMKQHSFEAEVSLLIMRYASELAARGVLFAVKDSKLCGLGQFGLNHASDGKRADELVRELRIPLDRDSVFARVVRTGEPFVGPAPHGQPLAEQLNRVGDFGQKLSFFVLPLTCNESPTFVIYGDNYPGDSELNGTAELVALANQASLVLERIALRRRIEQLESRS